MLAHQKNNIMTVSEHQPVQVGYSSGGPPLEKRQLESLQRFHSTGVPYFTLIHNGVKFNEYVGVLKVGTLTIEVLPKMDRGEDNQKWRQILLGMLHAVGIFDIHAPSSSQLSLKSNSILDLYFELFIKEVEMLLRAGLVKKYRKTEGNKSALKGSILFANHIRENIVHQERFYVRHVVYDPKNHLNQILYKTLKLLQRINTNVVLSSRIGTILLDFPEMPWIRVSSDLFSRLSFSRRTEPYRKAIAIAKLLLLQYHPDIKRGQENVLALMFDMNILWERFVYLSLLKNKKEEQTIEPQSSKDFWKPERGSKVRMRPDIVVNKGKKNCFVLDTKWKNLKGMNPSPEDLRQMFTYSTYYQAPKTMLIYPGKEEGSTNGKYFNRDGILHEQECGIINIAVKSEIREWQKDIARRILHD